MPAIEPFCKLFGIDAKNFSKEENILLESEFFILICIELEKIFKLEYKAYFQYMNFTVKKEDQMMDVNFMRFIINDIIASGEYTIQGIANYTGTHEDIIIDLASGLNTKPLMTCFRKTIELHRMVRRELYYSIAKKIAAEYYESRNESIYTHYTSKCEAF